MIRLPMPYAAAKVRMHLNEVIRANQVTKAAAGFIWCTTAWASGKARKCVRRVDLLICTAPLPNIPPAVDSRCGAHGRHAAARFPASRAFPG